MKLMFHHYRLCALDVLLFYCAATTAFCGEPAARKSELSRQPGVVAAEFIFEDAPYPECHASTIAETPSGLVAAWFGGTNEKHPDVGIWLSRHVDGHWTEPVEVANGVQSPTLRYPTWNPVLFQPKDGPLLLFYKVGPSPDTWWGMLTTSSDGGVTWSEPRKLPEGVIGPVKNKPVQLDDGTLLCPSSTEHEGWRLHLEFTPDLGETWRLSPPLNDGRTKGAIQPAILFHANGDWQILARDRRRVGTLWSTWSKDKARRGRNWNPPGSRTQARAPTRCRSWDGRHLLVYNHSQRPNELSVSASRDRC